MIESQLYCSLRQMDHHFWLYYRFRMQQVIWVTNVKFFAQLLQDHITNSYTNMRNQWQGRLKNKHSNLSQTTDLRNNQQSIQNSFQRYRRTSLPNSIGHYATNVKSSIQQPAADIYFNPSKKSKFMKEIVDNYFEETLQKIYGNEKQSQGRQIKTLQRNFKNISKRQKLFYSSIDNGPYINRQAKNGNKQPPKQPADEREEMLVSKNSSTNTSSFLPPIYESHEDIDDLDKMFPQMYEAVSEITLKEEPTSKTLIFQNEAFKIFIAMQNGQPQYRIKQFKPAGLQILKRQERALKYGIQRIWKQSQINAHSFVSQMVHPLKNLICKISPHHEGNIKFKVRSTNYRKYLLANNCLELRYFIREVCGILKKIQGRVLNNKVNPSNIFILKGNRICIGEWGYSSFRDEYQIQQNKFESRINPILKSSKQWLATPEYLSPELLQAIAAKNDQEEPDIWENKSSSDIWSLGITLFQILTMIPIWIFQTCNCKSKTKKPVVRAGLLGTDDRKLTKIIEKQKKIEKSLKICLQNQIQQGISKDIVALVDSMIVYDPSQRITLDQIIAIAK